MQLAPHQFNSLEFSKGAYHVKMGMKLSYT